MTLRTGYGSWSEIIAEEMGLFLQSERRREMLTGERYYQGRHDILTRQKTVVGSGGRPEPCEHLANSRVVDNQYARVVDQKVSYLLGKPLTVETERRDFLPALSRLFGPDFRRRIRLMGEDSLNCGIGWLHPCYSAGGQLRFRRIAPWELLPFWADDAHSELEGALRVYTRERGGGQVPEVLAELFTPEGLYRFSPGEGAAMGLTGFEPYFLHRGRDGVWPGVPLIPFRAGFREIPLIRRVKGLQDGINVMLSDVQDRMGEDTHHTVLVIHNYDGEDLGEFRRNLAVYGAVKVRSDVGAEGGVETLRVEVDADSVETVLSLMKKALIENAKGFDLKDLSLAGSPNQMTIQSMYADMELDAGVMEVEFAAALRELMGFVCVHLEQTGLSGLTPEDVEVIFNRDVLINESESIDNCLKSLGMLSRETVLYQHPWTSDVEKELRRLDG